MRFRGRNRGRGGGNWNFFEIFISGVFGLITINYLIFGFADVVMNIHTALVWVNKHGGLDAVIYDFFRQIFQRGRN